VRDFNQSTKDIMITAHYRTRWACLALSLGLFLSTKANAQWVNSSESYNQNGDSATSTTQVGSGTGGASTTWFIWTSSFSSSATSANLTSGLTFHGQADADNNGTAVPASANTSRGIDSVAWGYWDWTGGGNVTPAGASASISISGFVAASGGQGGTVSGSTNHVIAGAGVWGDIEFYDNYAGGPNPQEWAGASGWAHGQNHQAGDSDADIGGSANTDLTTNQHVRFGNTTPPFGESSFEAQTDFTISFNDYYETSYGATSFWAQCHQSYSLYVSVVTGGTGASQAVAHAEMDVSGSVSLDFTL
jgi:hypothetical protein